MVFWKDHEPCRYSITDYPIVMAALCPLARTLVGDFIQRADVGIGHTEMLDATTQANARRTSSAAQGRQNASLQKTFR